jgi:hypothetical protein
MERDGIEGFCIVLVVYYYDASGEKRRKTPVALQELLYGKEVDDASIHAVRMLHGMVGPCWF